MPSAPQMSTTPPSALPTSGPAGPPDPPPGSPGPGGRRLRGVGSGVGIVISAVALGLVVWWALKQDPPQLPHTAGQIAALIAAIALYGFNTLVRSERWHRLLGGDRGAPPPGHPHSPAPGW